jgi:hypothetical protein
MDYTAMGIGAGDYTALSVEPAGYAYTHPPVQVNGRGDVDSRSAARQSSSFVRNPNPKGEMYRRGALLPAEASCFVRNPKP